MNKFNVAIECLRNQDIEFGTKKNKQAIAILESYSKWEPLIEVAKKTDKGNAIGVINDILTTDEVESGYAGEDYKRGLLETRILLESMPEEEKP
jgi:hypothetical protein